MKYLIHFVHFNTRKVKVKVKDGMMVLSSER